MTTTVCRALTKPLADFIPWRGAEHLKHPGAITLPHRFEPKGIFGSKSTLDNARYSARNQLARARDEQLETGFPQTPGPLPITGPDAVEERLLEVVFAQRGNAKIVRQSLCEGTLT